MLAVYDKTIIRGGRVVDPASGIDAVCDLLIENGRIAAIGENLPCEEANVIDAAGKVVAPGFIDMHCHLRDPGQEYKEDLVSGTKSAARGGFTGVCCMPNTRPVNDNASVTRYIIEKAQLRGSGVHVYPVGAISKGLEGTEMAEIGRMKQAGIIAISDDGKPVKNSNLLRLAMQYADYFGVFIMSHSEDKNLVGDGVMNEGYMSTKLGLPGITRAAEEVMIARDILVAEAEGKRIHLCHVSTRGGVQLVREAKKRGVRVTAETAPHYIGATDEWVAGYDSNCRVNPPLREEEDRLACIAGLCDGTLDAIATDHAPHHQDEKRVEFHIAASGISGFETAFCVSYTELVKKGYMSLSQLIEKMSAAPAKLLGVEGGSLAVGSAADVVVLDPERELTVDAEAFASKGHNTPFHGKTYSGAVCMTMVGGRVIYEEA
ncbi:MAG: dihydroorotase [Clostridia bacterium]|nr:dihydroorotase [Clostridia bacterium]